MVLNPTPKDRLLDAQRRPYFLWDCDVTLESFEAMLRDENPEVRGYWIGKLMRQAKPDDVFQFVSREEIEQHWTLLERYLGRTREFWIWLLDAWRRQERAAG